MAGIAATAAGPAWAGLEICNQTGERRSIAIGYQGDRGWTSEGWWIVEPGQCKVVISGDLQQRYYYYRATDRTGGFNGEGYMFCTDRQAFTIYGDTNCEARGFREDSFREIDTGPSARSFSLTLTAY